MTNQRHWRESREENLGRCQQCGSKVPASLVYGAIGSEWDVVEVKVKPHDCRPNHPSGEPVLAGGAALKEANERANVNATACFRAREERDALAQELAGARDREASDALLHSAATEKIESLIRDRDRLAKEMKRAQGIEEEAQEYQRERDQARAEVERQKKLWREKNEAAAEVEADRDRHFRFAREAEQDRDHLKRELHRLTNEHSDCEDGWKRRAESAEQDRDALRKANLEKYGTTEANELLQLRAERDRLAKELVFVRNQRDEKVNSLCVYEDRLKTTRQERDLARADAEHWKEEHAIAKSHWQRRALEAEKERNQARVEVETWKKLAQQAADYGERRTETAEKVLTAVNKLFREAGLVFSLTALEAVFKERDRLKAQLETHAPEGHNVSNEQWVNILKERDVARKEAKELGEVIERQSRHYSQVLGDLNQTIMDRERLTREYSALVGSRSKTNKLWEEAHNERVDLKETLRGLIIAVTEAAKLAHQTVQKGCTPGNPETYNLAMFLEQWAEAATKGGQAPCVACLGEGHIKKLLVPGGVAYTTEDCAVCKGQGLFTVGQPAVSHEVAMVLEAAREVATSSRVEHVGRIANSDKPHALTDLWMRMCDLKDALEAMGMSKVNRKEADRDV